MHWSLKRALGQSGGDLCGVWEQMHGMIRGQLGKIIVSFQESVNRVDAHHNKPFYQPLWGQVSRHALELLHDEFTRSEEVVGTNEFICGCVMRTTHGLPCACNLGVLHTNVLPITLDMIDSHWKRLSMECLDEERMKEASHDCDLTYTIEEVYRKWGSFNIEEKCVWKRGLDDYVFKETTNMVPPMHKVKTRGAPRKDKKRKKKDYDARRDPSHWEHVDRMDEAEDEMLLSTLKSSLKSKKKSTQKSTQKSINKSTQKTTKKTPQESTKELANVFKKAFKSQEPNPDMEFALQFPNQIQRYIDNIINVDGDGNCGFRCIAALMCWGQESWNKVRLELGEEMDMNYSLYRNVMGDSVDMVRESLIALPNVTFQPKEKWMSMPDLGHVIATLYQVALVMLSPTSSTCFTFLPLRGEYLPSQSRLLCVGFVNKGHWVRVLLNHTSPMPPIYPSWGAYCSGETHSWYTPYMGRLQLWENIFQSHSLPQPSFPPVVDYIDITEM